MDDVIVIDDDHDEPPAQSASHEAGASRDAGGKGSQSEKTGAWVPAGKPPCIYGARCYRHSSSSLLMLLCAAAHLPLRSECGLQRPLRHAGDRKNEIHLAEFSHPPPDRRAAAQAPERTGAKRGRDPTDDPQPHKVPAAGGASKRAASYGEHLGKDDIIESCDGLSYHLMYTSGLPDEHNRHARRVRNYIKTNDAQWALMGNYMQDEQFIFHQELGGLRKFMRIVMFHHAQYPPHANLLPPNVVTHAPRLPSFGTHHSKFFVLAYTQEVRVIVITANSIQGDFYDMTDAIWAKDFPKKAKGTEGASDFENDLVQYFEALQWPGTAFSFTGERITAASLRAYDYSKATVRLIASVPGSHTGQDLHKWGHMKLRRVLGAQRFSSEFVESPIVAQFSSIGSIQPEWLADFEESVGAGLVLQDGHEGSAGAPGVVGAPRLGRGRLCLVWPTMEEMRRSLLGWIMGGPIPGRIENLAGKDWEKNLKKHLISKYCMWSTGGDNARENHDHYKRRIGAPAHVSFGPGTSSSQGQHDAQDAIDPEGRGRSMPHIKTLVRHHASGKSLAWLYLGSHNLSGAAWGSLNKNKTQLRILSYELGVLFLPSLVSSTQDPAASGEVVKFEPTSVVGRSRREKPGLREERTLAGPAQRVLAFPIPYRLPPRPYRRDVDIPWAVKVSIGPLQDSQGNTLGE